MSSVTKDRLIEKRIRENSGLGGAEGRPDWQDIDALLRTISRYRKAIEGFCGECGLTVDDIETCGDCQLRGLAVEDQ